MSQDFKTFLAASVLNDGKIVGSNPSVESDDALADVLVPGILSISGPRTQSALQCREEVRRDQALSEESADLSIRMLYEFYSTQTTKKPASINATYLLDGVPRNAKKSSINGHQQDGEEIHMQSSPYMSSSMPHQDDEEEAVPSRSIILAKGEDLEGESNLPFVGLVYSAASVLSAAEKDVSGKSKI